MKKILFLICIGFSIVSCDIQQQTQQTADSGVKKATVKVKTDINGHSVEQKNIIERTTRDNNIGSIKHLYVISSYTGDVLEYSTVKGKVTSGGKRLSPKSLTGAGEYGGDYFIVNINGSNYRTSEVLDENGTYGESGNYLYWFDTQDNYHQYYPSGGTYLHISDKPLKIKKANFTLTTEK